MARAIVHGYRDTRIALFRGHTAWRCVGPGLEMEIDPHDPMDCAFYLGTYEPGMLRIIRRVVRSGDTCVDVGAQRGYFTLHLAAAVGPAGRVFAFEPDPRAFEALARNLRHNALTNVKLSPYALGDRSGECRFALSAQVGWSSRFPNEIARPTLMEEISVPLRSFDELVESGEFRLDPKKLAFIKIDVEGSEPLVLQGMRNCLEQSRAAVWVEVNPGSLAAAGFRPADIICPLEQLGYALQLPRHLRRLGVPCLALEPYTNGNQSVSGVHNLLASASRTATFETLRRNT